MGEICSLLLGVYFQKYPLVSMEDAYCSEARQVGGLCPIPRVSCMPNHSMAPIKHILASRSPCHGPSGAHH